MSTPMTYTINGSAVTAEWLKKRAPKRSASPKDPGPPMSLGFRVEGHPPGAMECAKEATDKAFAEWSAMGEAELASALKEGRRQPKAWDEADWRRKTKPKAVRSKPYEIEGAAMLCADLARKGGWLDVRVTEILRGAPPPEAA